MGQAYLALFADAEFARLKNEAYEEAIREAERNKGRPRSKRVAGPSLEDFKKMKGDDYMQYLNNIGF